MLLDTSGLLSLFDRRDHRRADAEALYHAASQRIAHDYVLAEFVALPKLGACREQGRWTS